MNAYFSKSKKELIEIIIERDNCINGLSNKNVDLSNNLSELRKTTSNKERNTEDLLEALERRGSKISKLSDFIGVLIADIKSDSHGFY